MTSSPPSSQGNAVRVTDEVIPLGEALEIVTGYVFGSKDIAWTRPVGGVGEPLGALSRGVFAYRTYDCIAAAPSSELEPVDVLVADGLNAQMRAKDIAGALAVAGAVSDQLKQIDSNLTFWSLPRDEIESPPTDEHQLAWPIWRAWTILMGVDGIDIARTHKILHHKRPRVFPLIDNQTIDLVGRSTAWITIYDDLKTAGPVWDRLEHAIRGRLGAADAPLSRLRLHDILLWTRATGNRDVARGLGAR
ncbi:MAG: DUF6308 family protein [Pseudonocardiaceae bacterium]